MTSETSKPAKAKVSFRAAKTKASGIAGFLAVSLLAAALSLAPFAAGPAAAASPDKTNYQNSPITSSGRTIPRVLLVLAKDRKMFQQAYNDLTDMDGDGRIDTGFNPSVIYHGYFDPKGCYQYTEKGALTDYLPEYRNVSADQHFVRMTDTIEDDSQASLDSQKARAGLSSNVKAARAAHFKTGEKIGICQRGHDDVWGLFSGNWLNYVSMTRMDVIRKVLYGGKRRVDSDKVILESSFVPADAHVWGTDVLADNRWESETPLTNYYDIGKYTPFPKPKTDSAHYFARVRNLVGSDYDDFPTYPTLEYILDATPEIFKNLDGVTGKGRYFNWVLGDRPNPSPQYLKAGTKLSAFSLLVNPCSVHSVGEYENCRSYARDIKKPIGLLQKNGEGGQMLFGLLTGSYHVLSHEYKYDGTRIRGGVLRNHMGDISRDVDPETGAFTKDGIYHFLDILTIAAHRPKAGDMPVAGKEPAWSYTYEQAVSWGNPMGEMLYEGTRYFQRLTQTESGAGHTEASPKYLPPRDGFGNYEYAFWADQSPHPAELVTPHYGPSYIPSWAEIPALPAADCAKPVILVISDIDPDYDGDNFEKADLDRPILSSYLGTQGGNLPGFSLYDYLKIITANEGFNRGSKYFYSTGPYDNCLPKTLSNLIEVKGLCPNSPAFEGTYSAAAVAHYAHTHTFSSTGIEMPVDFYAVTMSSTFPALDFPVFDSSKNVAKKISIVPASMSDRDPDMTVGKVLSFLNYYVIDWQVDQRGTPYHVKVRVNFEDAVIGKDKYGESDWDSDMLMEYTIDLVTDSNAPLSKRLPDVIKMTGNVQAVRTLYTSAGKVEIPGEYPVKFSGALKKNAKDYYYFKTPNANSFTIEPAEVKGLIVATWKAGNNTTLSETLGYTISGTTRDGTYMDQGQLMGIAKNATPYTCNWPAGYGGATADDGTGCGVAFSSSPTGNYYAKPDSLTDIQHRTFEFNTDPATAGVALPNPLFLAAKYGGFVDHNSNGLPDPGEWEGSDGVTPRNYFEASNITELPSKLEDAFKDIARSISTGTATSASVDTILGGGVSVQTLYYPLYVNPDDSSQSLRWVGSVFGLFVDKWGNLREDNHDPGVLDPVNGEDGSEGDYVVTFNSTREESANPPKCYEFGSHITRCYTPDGSNNPKPFEVLNDRHPANIHRIKPLFDTGRWLSRLDDAKLLSGSRPERSPANLVGGRRRIFYGAPSMNAAGIPETVLAPFTLDAAKELSELMLHDNFFDQLPGYKDKVEAAKALVTWITGVDVPGLRSREVGDPWTDNATPVTWRLGDVINSKPILVGAPASHYDLLYNDPSYLAYKNAWSRRRQMVYFGGNDGMLHAVNVGFYGSLANGKVSFTESDPKDPSSVAHELGAELWAYIPTSLLPHLQWLPDPEYNHAYYVDLKPLVNDVKINGEWRTVLIGGLRLGGRPIEAPDPAVNNGERIFYAEVFALDITDPERDPKLLWRYSTLEQGLTVGMPSVISSEGKWYAIVPSGPLTDYELYYDKVNPLELGRSPYEGASKQRAKLSVLDAATGVELPHWGQNPDYLTADMDMSFFNNPFLPVAQKQENPWTNHTLYYGLTVTQSPDFCEDKGAVYRLQTVDEVTGNPLPTASWKLRKLFDTEKPVTGAVNSTYDNRGNLWVLFATGRLWTSDDINPCSTTSSLICVENHRQYLFGIKEDLNSAGRMTFKDMTGDAGLLVDVSGGEVHKNGGLSGVSPVSRIEGLETPPTSYAAFAKILKSPKTIGYKRRLDAGHLFDGTSSPNYSTATATLTYSTAVAPSLVAAPTGEHDYEMVITQPKLFTTGAGVSLMAFTSFEPKKSGCGDIGNGYLYLVDTFTGLPEPSTFGVYYSGDTPPPSGLAPDRVMGVISTGPGTPTEAFVTMGADGITVSASAPDFTISSIFLPDRDDPPNKVTSWKEVLDTGFVIPPDVMTQGLN